MARAEELPDQTATVGHELADGTRVVFIDQHGNQIPVDPSRLLFSGPMVSWREARPKICPIIGLASLAHRMWLHSEPIESMKIDTTRLRRLLGDPPPGSPPSRGPNRHERRRAKALGETR